MHSGFLCTALIHAFSLLMLGYLPFRRQFGMSGKRLALLSVNVTLLYLCQAFAAAGIPLQAGARILLSFLTELAAAGICRLSARQSYAFHLFLVFMAKSYVDTLALLAKSIVSYTGPAGGSPATELVWQLVLLACTLPLLSVPLRRYLGGILKLEPDRIFWRYICIIPIGAFVLHRAAIDPDYLGLTWHLLPLLTPLLWLYLSFLSYIMVFKMCCTAVEADQLAREVRIANLTAEVKAKQNDRLNRLNAQTRKGQSQLLERLQTLRGRLEADDPAGAEALLATWLGQLGAVDTDRICENAAVDGVLRQYLGWAAESGVRTEVHLNLPARLPIPELDFFVIFGNLLENALEACIRQTEGGRFLSVTARITGGTLLLSVTNSYSGAITKAGDAFCSSKQEGRIGLGIASVQAAAARYDGAARFQGADGVFEAAVMLPIPPEAGGAL